MKISNHERELIHRLLDLAIDREKATEFDYDGNVRGLRVYDITDRMAGGTGCAVSCYFDTPWAPDPVELMAEAIKTLEGKKNDA